jgi:tetratricopeptide (TPR) repeat protein
MGKALDVYEQLLEQQGEDEQSKQFAVATYAKMARIHHRMQQYTAARTALESGIAIGEDLLAQHLDQWEYRAELVGNYNSLSNALERLSLHQESFDALDRARNHATALAGLFPDASEYQIDLVMNDQNRAATLLSIGHLDEAERSARGAQQR